MARRGPITADELVGELDADPTFKLEQAKREEERAASVAEFRQAAEPLIDDLRRAGIDPTDFGRFVNRPVPGAVEPATFDAEAATPVLLHWLPRIDHRGVKQSIVGHLNRKDAGPDVVVVLLREFDSTNDAEVRAQIADALTQFSAVREFFAEVLKRAANADYGWGRAPFFGILWRVKTDEADQLIASGIEDGDVAFAAMSSTRRRWGNAHAREQIAPLAAAPDKIVRTAAVEHLKRIDRAQRRQAGS